MPTLQVIFAPHDTDQRQAAETLPHAVPAQHTVTLTPLPSAGLPAPALDGTSPDVVLLLDPHQLEAVRAALGDGPHPTKLIATWNRTFPDDLNDFLALRAAVDGWIFHDPIYWEGTGRLPNTSPVATGPAEPAAAFGAAVFDTVRRVLEGNGVRSTPLDRSAEVTVFVTTVGAPTFDSCLAHLREQDCTFTLRIVDRVAPMNAAFQRMLDECRTPYYVQVDEDMLLYPHAVRTLYETMQAAEPRVAMVAGDLYDPHVARCILGVKLFRHAIARQYPFDAIDAFERQQVMRMEADGYRVLRSTPGLVPVYRGTLGLHGTRWTHEAIFERYRKIEHRRWSRRGEMQWFESYPARFLERFLADPSDENFFALMGVIAGRIGSGNGQALAKDYRTYAALPGFEALRRFLHEARRPAE